MTDKKHINDSLKNSDKNFNENFTHNKEQIIIDGVDIGKCTFSIVYLGNIICGTMSDRNPKPNCSKYPNCYFKQLVRKTQLSIEQSKELIRLRQELKESTVKNKNLRQECEELKKNNKILCDLYESVDLCLQKRTEKFDRYRKECDFWKHQAELGSETTDRLAKQLEEKEQECEQLKEDFHDMNEQLKDYKELHEKLIDQNASLQKQVEDMLEWQKTVVRLFDRTCRCSSLDEKTAMCKENGKECISIVGCRDRYRKALEEIEKYVQSQLDGFGNDVYAMDKVAINEVLDIINKAKGEGNE